ncbi:MAG TPA: response regulator [bacterium]
MKDLSQSDMLEILGACLDLLASREDEIRALYDRIENIQRIPGSYKNISSVAKSLDDAKAATSPDWPAAIAVSATPNVGRSLTLLFPHMGLRIQGITDSGLEGLTLVEKHKPEFAFVDLDVKDIDSHVLISRMKEVQPDLIVIALSSGNEETVLVSATIAGAKEVIAKPIQSARVINTVNRLKKESDYVLIPAGKLPDRINPTKSKITEGWTVL